MAPIELGDGTLYIHDESGWTDIGRTEGGIRLEVDPPAEPAHPSTEGWGSLAGRTVSIILDMKPFLAQMAEVDGALHDFGAAWQPRAHIRCHRCHPAANPKPLPINGHEYHRRQMARKRRRR